MVVISALAGAGGIGKTWLALHWAHRFAERFPDGQLFVDLRGFSPDSQPMSPDTAIRGFLDAFGIDPTQIPVDLHAQATRYRSLVSGKRMLIFLDNAADTTQITPLLPGTPTATVLVTSRNQLPGLITGHDAHHVPVDILPDADARALLATRLGADRVTAEPAAVEQLLASCGGFPLALSIVAGRAHTHPGLPLATLAAELRDAGLDALDDGDPAASLPTVLSWSYRALTGEQARVFGLLGIAPGADISLSAAVSLAGLPTAQTRTVLRELTRVSLLGQDTRGRYGMHDLIRRYAARQAVRDQTETDRHAALRRVIDFYLHTAHPGHRLVSRYSPPPKLDPAAPGCHPHPLPDQAAAFKWFEAEHACLLASQHAAAAHGWHQVVWQLAFVLDNFHNRRGHLHERVAAWQAGLVAADHFGDPITQSVTHRFLGDAYTRVDRPDEAQDHLRQALTLAEHTNDLARQAHAHNSLAWAWEQQGNDQQALEHAARAKQLHQTLDDPIGQARALNNIGWYTARLGDYDQARMHCEAALTLHRCHHNRDGEANTLNSLGYIAHHTGDYTYAVDYYRQALTLFRDLGDTYHQADILDSIGHPHVALGHHEQARAGWLEALTLYQAQHRSADAERVQQQLDALDRDTRGTDASSDHK